MKIEFLIVSHSNMSKGTFETMRMLGVNRKNISYITAYENDTDFEQQIKEYLSNHGNDKCVVFTDLLGGSVNTKLVEFLNSDIYLIAGFNLPLLLEMVFLEEINEDIVRNCILTAKESIVYVNDLLNC